MGNGLGLPGPSSLVLGTRRLEGGRGLAQDKGLPGGWGLGPSLPTLRGARGEARPGVLEASVCRWPTALGTSFLLFGHQCPHLSNEVVA